MPEDVSERRAGPLLLGSLEYVWSLIRGRFTGLTEEEYQWEPVSGCWSVWPRPDGRWEVDRHDPQPSPPPVTTIVWRLFRSAPNLPVRFDPALRTVGSHCGL